MTRPGSHADIGPELRKLAQRILDQIDPAVRLAAARAVGGGAGTGTCQQVWCPVCALAAVVTGDEHPLQRVPLPDPLLGGYDQEGSGDQQGQP